MEKEEEKKQTWYYILSDFFINLLKKFGYIIFFGMVGYLLGLIQGATLNSSLKDLAIGWSTISYQNKYYCDINNKNIKYTED